MELPMEVVHYIVSYIDNIDVRRSFGIYSKIDLSKHRDISFGYKRIRPYNRELTYLNIEFDEYGEPPQHVSRYWSYSRDIYVYLHNLFDSEERSRARINNDSYEVLLSEVKRGSEKFTKFQGTIQRYVPVDYFEKGEPWSDEFVWKQIYVHYERPYVHPFTQDVKE
jgi:hypothetical protein